MDATALDLTRREAGAQYLAALRTLGLEPNGLFWAYDEVTEQFVLFLVTDLFDVKGPYEISKLLFKAYNNSGTPREVDPFIVRLHSPRQTIISSLMIGLGGAKIEGVDEKSGKPLSDLVQVSGAKLDGIQVFADWVYKQPDTRAFKRPPANTIALSRKWERFMRSVNKLAA